MRDFKHGERRIMTTLRLSALGDTRATCAGTMLGGASILAITGVGTEFKRFEVKGGPGEGFVARSDNGAGVSGPVLVSIMPNKPDEKLPEHLKEVVAQGGQFFVEVGEVKDAHVQAHYLGVYPYAACDSRIVEV